MERVIWTPKLFKKGMHVYLDYDFAKEMISAKAIAGVHTNLNRLGSEEMKRWDLHYPEIYTFYKDSCLVNHFYIGQNGIWLDVDTLELRRLEEGDQSKKPIKYESHNLDSALNSHIMLSIFDKWIEYSDILKGK